MIHASHTVGDFKDTALLLDECLWCKKRIGLLFRRPNVLIDAWRAAKGIGLAIDHPKELIIGLGLRDRARFGDFDHVPVLELVVFVVRVVLARPRDNLSI
jgi:hypothetical protein